MQQTYTVLPGDSLSAISKKFFGDFSMTDAIAKMNGVTNQNLIYPGQLLKIPDVADAVVITEDDEAKAKNKKTWMWILLLAAGAGAGYLYYNQKKKKGQKTDPEKKKASK